MKHIMKVSTVFLPFYFTRTLIFEKKEEIFYFHQKRLFFVKKAS